MKTYKHLKASMSISNTPGQGACFFRSAALVLDLPGSELVMGTFRAGTEEERAENPAVSDEPFIHAWVEHQGIVYAPTTIEVNGNKLVPIVRDHYYEINGAKDIFRLSRKDLIGLSGRVGLSQHLLRNKPLKNGASFAASIMDQVGLKWKDSKTGGVIPA